MLPVQGAQVWSLVRELDPACRNWKSPHAATKIPRATTKTRHNQKNKKNLVAQISKKVKEYYYISFWKNEMVPVLVKDCTVKFSCWMTKWMRIPWFLFVLINILVTHQCLNFRNSSRILFSGDSRVLDFQFHSQN